MPQGNCPPPAELERLFLGGVPEGQAEALEQHVLRCAACLETLQQRAQARDVLAGMLRQSGSDPDVSSATVETLMRKLKSWRPGSPGGPSQGSPMISMSCSGC